MSALERPRHACDLKVEVLLPDAGAGRHLGEGTLINISLGDGSLSFPGPLLHGVRYALRLTKPAAVVLSCRVWCDAGASGGLRCYGVRFDLPPEQEAALSGVLAMLAARGPANAEETCDGCGSAFAAGVGRFRRGDGTVCLSCHDSEAKGKSSGSRSLP